MKVKKVNGGYRITTYVCGYRFGKTYFATNRSQAIALHTTAMLEAMKFGSQWIDKARFNEYE